MQTASRYCNLEEGIALTYVLLTMLALPLYPGSAPLTAAEIMVPPMLWLGWRKRHAVIDFCRHDGLMLIAAASAALLAAAVQQIFTGSCALYDLAILGYMIFIYCFFRVTPLRPKTAFTAGAAIVIIIFAGWLLTLTGNARILNFIDPNMTPGESGGVLAVRYQFLFSNPNLLGSAFILPVVLMLPQLREWFSRINKLLPALGLIAAAFLLCLPLFATVSKHLILTLALLAPLYAAMPVLSPVKPRILTAVLLGTAIAGALVTVWFCTAPAVKSPPWVDFSRRGNYTTHQEIYLDIITTGGIRGMLTGYSPAQLRQKYPEHADAGKIAEILKPYGAEKLAETFAGFMDPHNEYLNFASHFGIPALLMLLIFLVRDAIRNSNKNDCTAIFFIIALLATFFWEDMASKRWMWATLGIIAAGKTEKME